MAALRRQASLYIINRENVPWLVEKTDFTYDAIVIDELSSFKNWSSKRFKALMKVRPLAKRVIGLTGTPSGNGLMDLFAEFKVLDMGKRLGRFITKYRQDYFKPDKRNGSVVFSYAPLPGTEAQIYEKISDITISMKAADHLRMPELIESEYSVRMNEEEKNILSNISYTGTMVLQKNYISEGHIRKRNKGELSMYLVEGIFEPLISRDDFDKAQEIRKLRTEQAVNRNPVLLPFSGMVKCGCCGGGFSRRTAGKYRRWGCNTRERKGRESCDSRPIKEEELVAAVRIVMEKDDFDTVELKRKVSKIVIHGDCVEFHLTNGRIKKTARIYNGQRGSNPFTNKVYCASCGSKCERDTWTRGTKVWACSQLRTKCGLKQLSESELKEAAESFFGDGYEGKIVQNVKRIVISDDEVIFQLKEGGAYRWQRQCG